MGTKVDTVCKTSLIPYNCSIFLIIWKGTNVKTIPLQTASLHFNVRSKTNWIFFAVDMKFV